MGDLTFGELKAEVKSALADRQGLDTRLGLAINLAQQRLARIHDYDEMEAISSTTLIYTGTENDRFIQLPNVREIYSFLVIDGTNSRKLRSRTSRWMDAQVPHPVSLARRTPEYYVLWGQIAEMYPMIEKNYEARVRYTTWPAKLVEDTDVSRFIAKDEVLIEFAIAYILYNLGKEDDARKHEARAKQLMDEAEEKDREKPDMEIVPGGDSPNPAPLPAYMDPFNKG